MRDIYQSQDYSIGVIPYCETKGQVFYLIIHHTKGHRAFPKGHPERHSERSEKSRPETTQQTALRELREETGVTQITLGNTIYTEHYEFDHKGVLVSKQVDYFLGRCNECRPTTIQPEETIEAGRYTYEQALTLLTFEESKNLLKQINNDLVVEADH